jgi:hypothetical protein
MASPARPGRGHAQPMQGIDLAVAASLRASTSARGCRSCGSAISLSDGFGLSERVCRRCSRRPLVRRLDRELLAENLAGLVALLR